jgi:cation transport ATPase
MAPCRMTQSLVFAFPFLYGVLGILIAAVVMLGSVSVMGNALRLRQGKP